MDFPIASVAAGALVFLGFSRHLHTSFCSVTLQVFSESDQLSHRDAGAAPNLHRSYVAFRNEVMKVSDADAQGCC